MSSPPPDDANPYSDDEAELKEVWEEGFRASRSGRLPPDGRLFNEVEKESAWMDGYTTALVKG